MDQNQQTRPELVDTTSIARKAEIGYYVVMALIVLSLIGLSTFNPSGRLQPLTFSVMCKLFSRCVHRSCTSPSSAQLPNASNIKSTPSSAVESTCSRGTTSLRSLGNASMKEHASDGRKWQALDGIASKLQIAIYVNVGISVAALPVEGALAARADAQAASTDGLLGLLGLGALSLQVISFMVAGIMFMIWMYRAHINSMYLVAATPPSEQAVKTAAVDVVGGWLIPVYNLFKPYQVMANLWRSSDPKAGPDANWRTFGVPASLGVWWGLWLLMSFAGRFTSPSSVSLGVTALLTCVDGFLAVQLMKSITERQTHLIHMRKAYHTES